MSREHIFGDKLAALFATVQRPLPVSANVRNKAGSLVQTTGGGRAILNEVSVCLCICCNTGFSDMMGVAQPLIFSLAKGESRNLDAAQISTLVCYFERLGYLADVLSSDYELDEKTRLSPHFKSAEWRNDPPVFSLNERQEWLRGLRSGNEPLVWLGRHRGVLGLNPETSVDCLYGRFTPQLRVHRRFHMIIRELAIEIQFPGAATEPYDQLDAYVRLDPAAASLAWPPERSVGYEDFFKLHQQSQSVIRQRLGYANPIACAMEEFRIREATRPA